jgi:hypothetical protein
VSERPEAEDGSDHELAAHDATPWIGVHVMTEFVFCPRAGLIAFEERCVDPGEELGRAPRLDYLPDFEVGMIEAALQKTWSRLWSLLTWTSPVVLIVAVAGFLFDWRFWLILVPLGVWFVRKLSVHLSDIVKLSGRLRAARKAAPKEPDPDSTEPQPVNWWSLLKSGFTPVEYEDPHENPDWNLAGKPWRVLHKGSLRIPIFRKRAGKAVLYTQHFARMAAYCRLIETVEGGSAPYGVVLFGDGYVGVTIPSTEENRELFREALLDARRLVEATQTEGLTVDAPRRATLCHECHVGRPRAYRKGITDTMLDGERFPAYGTRGEDGRYYHSRCGDRFRWLPPHDRARRKRLC